MNFINQIKDAIKYTFKDWKAIVLLGIILCLASTFEEWQTNDLLTAIILAVIIIALALIEEGYRYKIIKGTIKGDNKPPIIGNFSGLIHEGFLETVTLLVYSAVFLVIVGLYSTLIEIPGVSYIYPIIMFILAMVIYLTALGCAIYKALHNDNFFSAFNILGILKLYTKLGIMQTIFLIIVGSISLNLIFTCVLHQGIFEPGKFLEFILSFFINPILLLFITRLLALSGRKATLS
ncbi:DUF4013 domain-containing protein [Methanobrevibacter sp.]|uniref:DUF4013 domain-containing protein n=1 Tax=Methanobrevibacter sp. TaxID=66852 RepID=UPI00388D3D9A